VIILHEEHSLDAAAILWPKTVALTAFVTLLCKERRNSAGKASVKANVLASA
jgi:hypothetical protein